MRLPFIAATCVLVTLCLSGCGGGGGSSPTTAPVKVTVQWGERSRALKAPSSALSMLLELKGALPGGEDLAFVVNRHADPAAYEETYSSPQPARLGGREMIARFFAGNDASGDVVGIASGFASVKADGTGVPAVSTIGTIAQVVLWNGSLVVGQKKDLAVTASTLGSTSPGVAIAVTPGSIRYQVTSGAAALRVSNGQVEGLKAGVATVTAAVDGVTSLPATVTVTSKPVLNVQLQANEILYDPLSRKIYASIPGSVIGKGNTVTVIDPETGQIVRSISVGSEPSRMAISDDGKNLFVVLSSIGKVAQVDTATNSVVNTFGPGKTAQGLAIITDIAAVPGKSDSLVIAWDDPSSGQNILMFKDGSPFAGGPRNLGSGLVFSSADRLFAYDKGTTNNSEVRILAISGNGIAFLGKFVLGQNSWGPLKCVAAGGSIFTTWGTIIDPQKEGTFSLPEAAYESSVAPDPSRNRVYFAMWPTAQLVAFDDATFARVGLLELPLTTPVGRLGNLVVCGEDRVAVCVNSEILIIPTDHWR